MLKNKYARAQDATIHDHRKDGNAIQQIPQK